ncbi:MAG: TIGR02996 domain-containing protein [Planctomycetes bacterium]|nr:TIGR02996 domain-containing protein [Planctomycetota bacterium]
MSDRDALIAAICAQPDEDTPRLAFADWCDEYDEPARAAFVRAQVELARAAPWEPVAARARWHAPDVLSGRAFAGTLPAVDGFHVGWPAAPFRRGFGWALHVRAASLWGEFVAPLFDRAPVGKLHVWHGALDEWRAVAASDRVRHFRELVFNLNPIEPLRALRDAPDATGIADLYFQRASGAGMPEVLEDLMPTVLGRAVRGLHFHAGYESISDLIAALNTGGPRARLSFSVMGLTAEHVRRLFDGPATRDLDALHFRDEPLGADGLHALAQDAPAALADLTLENVGVRADGLESLARCDRLAGLRRLSLSRNPLPPRAVRVLSLSRVLAGVRALDLNACRIGDKGVRHLTQAKFWPNLVELDLRNNPISAVGVRYLLDAPAAPDLAALVLDAPTAGGDARAQLAKKYDGALVLAPPSVGD